MKKKLLGQLPLQSLKLSKKWDKDWLASVSIKAISNEDILVINLYKNEKDEKTVLPKFRVFISQKDDITQDIEQGSWNQKKLEYIMDGSRSIDYRYQFVDKTSEKHIDDYLEITRWSKGLDKVNNHQYKLRNDKSNRAYELRCKRIEDEMKAVDDLPMPLDFNEFIDNDVFVNERYAFYTTNNSRRYYEVTCCHCENTYTIDSKTNEKPKHNELGTCEHCKSKVIYKSYGKIKNIYEYKEVILMLKYKEGFVSKYYDVKKCSCKGYERYDLREKVRVIYTGKTTKAYYGNKYNWNAPGWWDSNSTQEKFGFGVLYSRNMNEVLNHTIFKYSALDLLASHKAGYMVNHNGYLTKYENNRYLEYFIKMGLYNLTNDIATYYTVPDAINAAGENVKEILQLTKEQIKRLIELDGSSYTLRLLQMENREGKRFTDDQIHFITTNNIQLSNLNTAIKFTSVTKVIKYLSIKRSYSSITNALNDWVDYLENCRVLGYDLEDDFILFPRHLKQAHDNLTNIILQKKQQKNEELFKERMIIAKIDYEYQTKKYAIVIPDSTDEIVKEGQTLHHCVGTYVNKVLEGYSTIVFVRLIDDLTTPFFTMEIKKGEIIQVRGKNNCDMPSELKRFVEGFKVKKLRFKPESEAV